jgi:uncharacterized membrane protein YozB (DUF420 family)
MTTLAAGRTGIPAERLFYTGMAMAILAAVVLGFARTFFLRPWFPGHPAPPEPFFMLHGAVFAAWFVLLVVQPSLVAAGRTDLHRRLGMAGAVLAVMMVVVGIKGALLAASRAGGFVGVPIPPLSFMAIPFFDMVIFAVLIGCAIARRQDPQTHKRLMLVGSISLLSAAIARWPFELMATPSPLVFFGITNAFLLAVVAWDLATRRRLHPATLWGGLLVVVSQPLRLVVSGTEPWLAFARWATGVAG